MRLFWELCKLSFQHQLTYRAATLAGLATNTFFGVLRAAVLIAFYGAQDEVVGLSLQGAITYTGITQAIIAYLYIFGTYDLMQSIYTGEVAADLLKPMSYFRFWVAREIGRSMANLLTRGLGIMLLYTLLFDISYPTGLTQWLALLLSTFLALLISICWRFLINLAAFWTPEAKGIGRFAFGITWITSGFAMPLRFFPDWFNTLCHFTPFPGLINTSVEVYLSLLTGFDLLQALALQVFWVLVLMLMCQVVLRAGVKRLVILGG